MKTSILISILGLISLSPCSGQKTRYGQSSPLPAGPEIKLHISAAHIRERCANVSLSPQIDCRNELYVDAVLNGKKVELVGPAKIYNHDSVVIVPGDYVARLKAEYHNADSSVVHQDYEVTLPKGAVWSASMTGMSE